MKVLRPRVPRNDGEIYLSPGPGALREAVEHNRALLAAYRSNICGVPFARLRSQAREEVLQSAIAYSRRLGFEIPDQARGLLVQTGHQPVLYHPGVWVKNHFCCRLARSLAATSINFIVDNDAPKDMSLKLPVLEDGAAGQKRFALAKARPGLAYQDYGAGEMELGRLRESVMEALPLDEMRESFAAFSDLVADRSKTLGDMVSVLTAARHALEERMGVVNLEVPVSVVSRTEAFAIFVGYVLANLERFREAYNGALGRYRRLYGVRYASNPLPDLRQEGELLEGPFWISRKGEPRQAMMARRSSGRLSLFLKGEEVASLGEGAIQDAEVAAAFMRDLEGRGLRLQPRALTMTMFFRIFAGDIFIHGIGGAKYDVVTDEVIRLFFREEAPAYVTLSATLYLPLRARPTEPADIGKLKMLLRDMKWNPDRHPSGVAEADEELAAFSRAKTELIARDAATRQARQEKFHAIRALNRWMRRLVEGQIEAVAARLDRAEQDLRFNAVVRDRDYPFCLYPRHRIGQLFKEAEALLLGAEDSARRAAG